MVFHSHNGKTIILTTPFYNGIVPFSQEDIDIEENLLQTITKEYTQSSHKDSERVFVMQNIPGLIGTFRSMIKERREKIDEFVKERRNNGQPELAFIWDTLIEYQMQDIKRLENLITLKKIGKDDGIKVNIDKAKSVPITNYIQFNRAGFAKCICANHQEKTPSMKLYKDKVHCFGCGFSGDVIDVVRELYGVEFIKAVQIILGK